MQGLRTFIHHPNADVVSHPDTRTILKTLDAAIEVPEPEERPLITFLAKSGAEITALLKYWATEMYGDRSFVWLADQVCREIRRLGVVVLVIDNAHRLDVPTVKALMKLRARRNNRLALIFGAQLAKDEQLDEPMGKLLQRAKIDPSDIKLELELKPLTEAVFYNSVLLDLFADLETHFEDGLEEHTGFIGTTLWEITAGDWKSINSRVKHFNRLLGQRSGRRLLTRVIVEQVLGKKLPN